MQKVWQIAGGEVGRKYVDLFLKHDVMFCGPGSFGPYEKVAYRDVIEKRHVSGNKIGQVRSFATQVQTGDLVLLRSGYRVVAIGIVHEDGYHYNSTFDDVYGWDLQHTHRVIWQHQLVDQLDQIQHERELFSDRKQIPTFTTVNDKRILSPIEHLLAMCAERELAALPTEPPASLSLDELCESLFAKGLPYHSIDSVRAAIEKQRRLINWYNKSGLATGRPTEHEVIAHIILPLLLALGWSEQFLAVEWNKIDLAVFTGTPTDRDHCRLVCEAKSMGHGLQDVLAQAKRYVELHRLSKCDKILLTDGQCFYLYRRDGDVWNDHPTGYLNIFKIRENHICPVGTNALDTLIALTPASVAT